MLKNIINFYRVSQPKPCNEESLSEQKQRLKRFQWSTFLAATLGYGMYYVCRLSLNVVKKPIVDEAFSRKQNWALSVLCCSLPML